MLVVWLRFLIGPCTRRRTNRWTKKTGTVWWLSQMTQDPFMLKPWTVSPKVLGVSAKGDGRQTSVIATSAGSCTKASVSMQRPTGAPMRSQSSTANSWVALSGHPRTRESTWVSLDSFPGFVHTCLPVLGVCSCFIHRSFIGSSCRESLFGHEKSRDYGRSANNKPWSSTWVG